MDGIQTFSQSFNIFFFKQAFSSAEMLTAFNSVVFLLLLCIKNPPGSIMHLTSWPLKKKSIFLLKCNALV